RHTRFKCDWSSDVCSSDLRIHILQSGYPLGVMHGYAIPAVEALAFVRRLRRLVAADMLADIEVVAEARRPLLAYAALVLEHIIRVAKPKMVVFSTFGVREGLLYSKLPDIERAKDGDRKSTRLNSSHT